MCCNSFKLQDSYHVEKDVYSLVQAQWHGHMFCMVAIQQLNQQETDWKICTKFSDPFEIIFLTPFEEDTVRNLHTLLSNCDFQFGSLEGNLTMLKFDEDL